MDEFEKLLSEHKCAIERFVKFKIESIHDAEDILQDVYLTAYQKYDSLENKESFKAWCISIACNKCIDYYRFSAQAMCVPIDSLSETVLFQSSCGISERSVVIETLEKLGDKDKQILYLYFFKGMRQEEIAQKLKVPLGTVKSRLHNAKERFRKSYPYLQKEDENKGDFVMKKLPKILPEYKIIFVEEEAFPVVFEELPNWFIAPKMGEEITWGHYSMPGRKLDEVVCSKVVCRINIHGVEGVEINTTFQNPENYKKVVDSHTYYAQLTDTHCRWLGESYFDRNGVKQLITFLDGDDFVAEWGFGEDNCGNETHLEPKGDIKRKGVCVTTSEKEYLFDVVGRYSIVVGKKSFDTVCIMEVFKNGAATEQYVDKNGKTILWRRFNRNDWAYDRYEKEWAEMFPENEQITINGEVYVHWYDCVTDYIF